MSDAILVLNAGSSSLKFSVFLDEEQPQAFLRGQIEGLMTQPRFRAKDASGQVIAEKQWDSPIASGHQGAIDFLLGWGRSEGLSGHRVVAAGHRVVHGGQRFTKPERVSPETLSAMQELVALAPLHQPHNLQAIRAVTQLAPDLPQVACFDTAFHHTQPAVAGSFALPRRFANEGVRRYGFHGLSYEYIASVLAKYDPRAATGRTVVAHLGNGASMCAMQAGRSVATTMGFTALDGLPMGTRCGSIDPGVLLYLMQNYGMDARSIERLLYHDSGLLGVSEISGDMRTLLASDDPRAAEAVELFTYRIGRELGSLATALGGIDALVFTGGIGENSSAIRQRVSRDAAWLGVDLDDDANAAGGPRISRAGSGVSVWTIATNEELIIAQHTLRVIRA